MVPLMALALTCAGGRVAAPDGSHARAPHVAMASAVFAAIVGSSSTRRDHGGNFTMTVINTAPAPERVTCTVRALDADGATLWTSGVSLGVFAPGSVRTLEGHAGRSLGARSATYAVACS
jgi:hypothetical protein